MNFCTTKPLSLKWPKEFRRLVIILFNVEELLSGSHDVICSVAKV
jgi:hypothetical protein